METKDRSALGRRSRRKGKAFELDIVHELRKIWPNAKRGIGQTRAGGEVPDVMNCDSWWVETKHRHHPNIAGALEQAIKAVADAQVALKALGVPDPPRRPPLAITRADGKPIIVSMLLDDFITLMQKETTPASPTQVYATVKEKKDDAE